MSEASSCPSAGAASGVAPEVQTVAFLFFGSFFLLAKQKKKKNTSKIKNSPITMFKNNGKLKLLIIVGTRPEIIRLAAVILSLIHI